MHLNKTTTIILLVAVAAFLFIPFLGRVHLFDWDEINFAECSREMIKLDDYSRIYVNFKPFWEKPPMFFWMQTVAMKMFGVNEFAARFPNAICGIVTLLVLFLCGRRIYDNRFGVLWALAYAGSLFPNMYFKSGLIDPWFNLFIFLSLYFFILYHWKRNGYDKEGLGKKPLYYAVWAGIFMGLAVLTKGQVALMIFLLVLGVYLVYNRFKVYFGWGHAVVFLLVAAGVTFTWYGYETIKNGPWFITEFLRYQYRLFTTHDAGQKGFPGYHFVVILFGCFPASLFAIPAFFKMPFTHRYDRDFKRWMVLLFWVVTILFTIVQSRIIHYSSMAWFPVTFLAAYTFYKWERQEAPYKKYVAVFTGIIGAIVSLLLLLVTIIAMNIEKLVPYVDDPFAQANMMADVHWSGWEGSAGVLMVLTVVLGLRYLKKHAFGHAAWTFFGGTAIVIFLAAALIVPKVERYSQGAAIDFLEERQGEDCYVNALGYWSYAPFFYARKEPPQNPNSYNEEWLLTGDIDKPVYFVTKVDRVENYTKHNPELKELYRKNGFVFLKRAIPGKAD
ncbi:ArnT family glycosyltransferase [Chitinophaga japonensis]|uniref:4-amino-4-deoxy-L-arabinose transferase-like glycosyltransferase n=1 Tax=Chitinophaga japonensis TaxID=104662 RepID=A0A562SP83_CHIJA|nr:glycosyltransferase family 39 protein [Chitinophaga japonensis]TWI82500.1 4-amino-4-deoxy-L-arabinose transferase-like glycosyltransferase [Chitinophaga japonensis]